MSDKENIDGARSCLLRREVLQVSGGSLAGGALLTSSVESAVASDSDGRWEIPITGPTQAEIGETKTYTADVSWNPDHLYWGASHEGGGSWPEVEEDGLSADVTFTETGLNTVSAIMPIEAPGYGSVEVEVTGGPAPVDVDIEGPSELVANKKTTFEAVPDNSSAEFATLNWDVLALDDSEFDITGSGQTVDIKFYSGGNHVVQLDYQTEEGYNGSTRTSVEVVNLQQYMDKKLALADEVSRLSDSLNERDQVEPALDSIEQQARDGDVSPTVARDAINRMRLAEDVTEKAFAGFGPGVATSPERDLVGEPSDSLPAQSRYEHPQLGLEADVNLSGETIGSVGWLVLGVTTGMKLFSKIAKRYGKIDEINEAREMAADSIVAAMSFFPTAMDTSLVETAKEKAAELVDFIETNEEDDKNTLLGVASSKVTEIRDSAGGQLFQIFEQSGGGVFKSSFDDHLQKVNIEMSGGGSEDISLQGTQNGAELAAERGGARTIDSVEKGLKSMTAVDIVSLSGDLISLTAGGLLAIGALFGGISAIVAAGVGIIGLFLTLSGELLSIMAGITQMYSVRETHEQSLDAIIAGEEWV